MMPDTDIDEAEPQPEEPQVSEDIQALLLSLARKVNQREIWARTIEIWETTEQRYFYKGQQFGFRNQDAGEYQVNQTGGGFNQSGQGSIQPTFRKAFNIYRGNAKSFIAAFCQSDVPTRFEPENPKESDDIQCARESNKMQRVIDKNNPPKLAQKKIAKFLWTDSRCVAWTRYVEDGERFGYTTDETGQRTPNGQEVTDYFGVLETKVPLIDGDLAHWDFAKISIDRPVSRQKSMYPDVKGITAGGLISTDQLAKMARIGTREGARQLTDDSISFITTEDNYWFRPSLYYELSDDDRQLLEEQFPTGVHLTAVGNVFCDAKDESMSDRLDVIYGQEDEGAGRDSMGKDEVPVQKEFNDVMNYASEIIKYCIPAGWHDPEAVDTDAIEEQASQPGDSYPIKKGAKTAGEPISNFFYKEQPTQFQDGVPMYLENLQGPLSQFLTGQQPAMFGGEMNDQKTARGYAMARDQAMGLMALVWVPFKLFRSSIMGKAVREAAEKQVEQGQKQITALVPVQGKNGEQEEIDVAVEEIASGKAGCFPVSDENFPESWTQKSNKFMQMMQFSAQDPLVGAVVSDPNNLGQAKDLMGLTDFTIPGADDREKQLLEIAEMRKSPPVPDMAAIQQETQQSMLMTGGPPPLDPSTLPMTSSVPIGKYDNDAVEFKVCVDWINGHEGQQAKRSPNPEDESWYQNVELHAGLHEARLQQQALAQAQQQMMMAQAQHPIEPPKPAAGKNNEGSLEKPKATPPEGGLPQTSGPAENPSPLQ